MPDPHDQAAALRQDAQGLHSCADRLEAVAHTLRRAGHLPPWMEEELATQSARCRAASAELSRAHALLPGGVIATPSPALALRQLRALPRPTLPFATESLRDDRL